VTKFNANTFPYLFIRWIVTMHIALSCVESEAILDWVLYICPALEKYLVESGDAIRRWIMKEFVRQKSEIKKELATARSRIHVSFDLWTSPNSKGLVGVIYHHLSKDWKMCSMLAGMRRLKGAHTGEGIAEVVIPIIKAMGVTDQLGFFLGDNAGPNDNAIRAILSQLRPDIKDPDSRRVLRIGHIINLAC
jgi:hypothetical protein